MPAEQDQFLTAVGFKSHAAESAFDDDELSPFCCCKIARIGIHIRDAPVIAYPNNCTGNG